MEKVKLTPSQIEAVRKALDHYNGDPDHLLLCHRNLMADGGQWVLWPALNELNASQLRQVLIGSFEIVTQAEYVAQPVKTTQRGEAMKHPIKIIRKVDLETQYKQMLQADIDYQLASLHDAMQRNDEKEIAKCKALLKELQGDLEAI